MTRTFRLPARLSAPLLSWAGATAGVAAVEFALVLPVMMVLFFGLADVTTAVNVDRKLTYLSRSLVDLSSRVSEVTTTEMANIFAASSAVMRPYDSSTTQMVVSSVIVTQSGQSYTGAVEWSCGKNLATKPANQTQAQFDANNLKLRPAGSAYTVPPGFQTPETRSFILVETLLPHQPALGKIITRTLRLRENTPWPVRNNDKVKGPATCPA